MKEDFPRCQREILETFWNEGLNGRELLGRYTECIDEMLTRQFERLGEARTAGQAALVALGGYGRRELFPFSDIDLLLLYDENLGKPALEESVRAIFYPLWDAGLELGHSVRTPAACLHDAAADYFFQVALLDARFITGGQELFNKLLAGFSREFITGRREAFFQAMLEHRRKRLEQFGIHSYMLEPNIKECRGGLRDVQTMLWSAKAVLGIDTLVGMEQAGLFEPQERQRFEAAWDRLIQVRNRLHHLSGRKNDQLHFEHQEAMAQALGYKKTGAILPVEGFMRDIHDGMMTIAFTAELFFEHVREILVSPERRRDNLEDCALEDGIVLKQGRLHLIRDEALLAKKPYLLMRLFMHAAKTGVPVHYRTKKVIQENLHRIDERRRNSKRVAKVFFEVLINADERSEALETMLDTGFLAAYLPEFRWIGSLVQHDVYHCYTVDRHSLQTVLELRQLTVTEAAVASAIAKPHILYLAGLLHDIGKGTGSGHAEKGALIARQVGERMNLPPDELETLCFLVTEHLFLPDTALRRDLDDERFIARCAQRTGNLEHLNMLYLLAIADARATGPTVWNEWKAALLRELFLKLTHVLKCTPETKDEIPAKAVSQLKQVRDVLRRENLPAMEEVLTEEYAVAFSPEEVLEHVRLREQLTAKPVLIQPSDRGASWNVLVMTEDRPGLLSRICGVFALHNLKILSAQIFTWYDGTVVDVLNVRSFFDYAFTEQDWPLLERDLGRAISGRLGIDFRLAEKLPGLRRAGGRRPRQRQAPGVQVDNGASEDFSIIEIFAEDGPGLLYGITRTLFDFGMNIFRAKIGTKADQVVYVFYIQDVNGKKVFDDELLTEIRGALLHTASCV